MATVTLISADGTAVPISKAGLAFNQILAQKMDITRSDTIDTSIPTDYLKLVAEYSDRLADMAMRGNLPPRWNVTHGCVAPWESGFLSNLGPTELIEAKSAAGSAVNNNLVFCIDYIMVGKA